MASSIPIRNIYFLLAYAWDRLPESNLIDVARLEEGELADLFATVLTGGVRRLLRQGLMQRYIEREDAIPGIRGKVDLAQTARRLLTAHGKAFCSFDELEVDVLPNQILRTTIRNLSLVRSLNPDLRVRLRQVDRELEGVSCIRLRESTFRSIQLDRNSRFYRFLLSVCQLAMNLSFIDEKSGDVEFRDFVRDERAMGTLFESFLFNYLKTERSELKVKKEQIRWDASSATDPDFVFLPKMETDVSIRDHPHTRTHILEAKFYKQTFQSYYDIRKLHSAHLYQLFAYLSNLGGTGPDSRASAMLVYPTVDREVDLDYELGGRVVQVRTLNLAASHEEIRRRVESFVEPVFGGK